MERVDFFRLKYTLTNICNYDYTYCVLHGNNLIEPVIDNLINYTRSIDKTLMSNFDEIRICFTGGEPTVFKDLIPFFKFLTTHFNGKKIRFTFVSNFSKKEKIIELVELFNTLKNPSFLLEMLFSYHPNMLNYNLATFLDDLKDIKNRIKHESLLGILFMLELDKNKSDQKINENILYMKNNLIDGVGLTYSRILGDENYYKNISKNTLLYKILNNKEDGDYFKRETRRVSNCKYYKCNGVVDSIHIRYNGDIFPCKNCSLDEVKLGNLKDSSTLDKLKKYKKAGFYLCQYDVCTEFDLTFYHKEKIL